MFKFGSVFLFLILICPGLVFAQVFPVDKNIKSCPQEKEIGRVAMELLTVELMGGRWPAAISQCVENTVLKFIHAEKALPGASPKSDELIVLKDGSIKLDSIKRISKYVSEFRVDFSGVDKVSGKPIKDNFSFMASSMKKGNKKPRHGCGHIGIPPRKIYVREDCLLSSKKRKVSRSK